ncbi:MAG: amidohydrolase [Acetobacteraceae bacterium]|nr:amidohydrolase [Acetobacteraceae bacterium]
MASEAAAAALPLHATAGAIDVDVHPAVPNMAALLPHMHPHWAEQMRVRGIDALESVMWKAGMPITARPDFRDPAGGQPGASLDRLRAQALDGFGTAAAICNPLWGTAALFSEDMASELCRAMNTWLAREWLDRETRLRGAITVAPQAPDQAAAEIERCAADRRFVSVLLPAMTELPLGRRAHRPIFAAAERHGLAVTIHAGGQYRHPPTPTGWGSFHAEDHAAQANVFQAQLLSLIYEGVFVDHPGLRVVLLDAGIGWLPSFLWRANKTWRGLRAEVPWVTQSPADILRRHVRFSLQPLQGPPDVEGMERLLAHVGAEDMLLFSTDYPHWRFEGQAAVPPQIPARLLPGLLRDTALETYPRLRESLP